MAQTTPVALTATPMHTLQRKVVQGEVLWRLVAAADGANRGARVQNLLVLVAVQSKQLALPLLA